MSDVIRIESWRDEVGCPPALPAPRGGRDVVIRAATGDDFAFIDALQKANSKAVGFMWEKAIRGHIAKGNVLVAEEVGGNQGAGVSEAGLPGAGAAGIPGAIGYVIGVDRYLKRDELGIIYQLNVVPGRRRSLVGANLLRARFERSAYGCRLYGCWCAQDLAANRFWEAMGFVPLAFRTGGGRGKTRKDGKFRGRMHIYWQKRIRPRKWVPQHGDPTRGVWVEDDIPYWFPSLTGGGAIGEDRIVLPIPPGTHWSDAKPIVLPNGTRKDNDEDGVKLLESEVQRLERERKQRVQAKRAEAKKQAVKRDAKQRGVKRGGLRFGSSVPAAAEAEDQQRAEAEADAEIRAAKRAVRRAKKKFDPAQEAFARELKDRWLEKVRAEPHLIAPAPGCERYNVRRRLAPGTTPAPGSANDPGLGTSPQVESQSPVTGTPLRLIEAEQRDAA